MKFLVILSSVSAQKGFPRKTLKKNPIFIKNL